MRNLTHYSTERMKPRTNKALLRDCRTHMRYISQCTIKFWKTLTDFRTVYLSVLI